VFSGRNSCSLSYEFVRTQTWRRNWINCKRLEQSVVAYTTVLKNSWRREISLSILLFTEVKSWRWTPPMFSFVMTSSELMCVLFYPRPVWATVYWYRPLVCLSLCLSVCLYARLSDFRPHFYHYSPWRARTNKIVRTSMISFHLQRLQWSPLSVSTGLWMHVPLKNNYTQ